MPRSKNLYFQKIEKKVFFILFEPVLISIAEDDKKKRKVVIKDIVSSIDRKAKMDQEFKSGVQGHPIFIFLNVIF